MRSVHQFAEKVALITDGANPVGRSVALQLALQGSFVVTVYASLAGGSAEVDELRSVGTLAGAVEADVSTASGARAAIDEVDRLFGRLDLLVNCLKFGSNSSFDQVATAAELSAAKFVTGAALRLMQSRPKPKIVNVTWSPGDSVAELTQVQKDDLPAKFRVNCVAVDRADAAAKPLESELLRPPSVVSPDDVARVISFLLSSESTALNGQVLKVG